MTIPFTCPCGQALQAPDEQAGRPVCCPACRQVIRVPPLQDLPSSPAGTDTAATGASPAGIPDWLNDVAQAEQPARSAAVALPESESSIEGRTAKFWLLIGSA